MFWIKRISASYYRVSKNKLYVWLPTKGTFFSRIITDHNYSTEPPKGLSNKQAVCVTVIRLTYRVRKKGGNDASANDALNVYKWSKELKWHLKENVNQSWGICLCTVFFGPGQRGFLLPPVQFRVFLQKRGRVRGWVLWDFFPSMYDFTVWHTHTIWHILTLM